MCSVCCFPTKRRCYTLLYIVISDYYPITNTLSEDTKLVQEYQEDEDRTNELNQEKINTEETALQGSPVSKLILYDLLRYIPAQEQAGKESCQRKEYLTRNEVEPIEQRLSEGRKFICCTQRERTEGSDDGTETVTMVAPFLRSIFNSS